MKYLLFLVFSLYFSISGYSQYYLGQSEKQIREVIDGEIVKDYIKLGDTKAKTLTWFDKPNSSLVLVMFNTYDEIIRTIISPSDRDATQSWVKFFNKNYVIVSEKEWTLYSDTGNTLKIKLSYLDEVGKYAFEISKVH